MDVSSFISPEYIRRNVLVFVNDKSLNKGLTKGWYNAQIYEAMSELSMDTYYNVCTVDVHNWFTEGQQSAVDVPDGCFSMQEVYAFNGDKFSIEESVPVRWKRNHNNANKISGHTSILKDSGTTYPYGRGYFEMLLNEDNGVLYANVQNGQVMLSRSCQSYSHIRLVFKGISGKFGETPVIPVFFKKAVTDYTVHKALKAMAGRDPQKYRGLAEDARRELEGQGRKLGSWREAQIRASRMSPFERESLNEYFKRGKW